METTFGEVSSGGGLKQQRSICQSVRRRLGIVVAGRLVEHCCLVGVSVLAAAANS